MRRLICKQTLRRLHAEGLTDRQLARRLEFRLDTVRVARQRLLLPPNLADRAAIGRKRWERLRRRGYVNNLIPNRARAALLGWPGLANRTQARVAQALWDGPLRLAGVASKLGKKVWAGTNDPIRQALNALRTNGVVRRVVGQGRRVFWELTEEGRQIRTRALKQRGRTQQLPFPVAGEHS